MNQGQQAQLMNQAINPGQEMINQAMNPGQQAQLMNPAMNPGQVMNPGQEMNQLQSVQAMNPGQEMNQLQSVQAMNPDQAMNKLQSAQSINDVQIPLGQEIKVGPKQNLVMNTAQAAANQQLAEAKILQDKADKNAYNVAVQQQAAGAKVQKLANIQKAAYNALKEAGDTQIAAAKQTAQKIQELRVFNTQLQSAKNALTQARTADQIAVAKQNLADTQALQSAAQTAANKATSISVGYYKALLPLQADLKAITKKVNAAQAEAKTAWNSLLDARTYQQTVLAQVNSAKQLVAQPDLAINQNLFIQKPGQVINQGGFVQDLRQIGQMQPKGVVGYREIENPNAPEKFQYPLRNYRGGKENFYRGYYK
jgi:hypothetical protein